MDVAIGLPNTVPGTTGEQFAEWAKRAEAAGFSTLGTIDRITYPNLEPLTALAAAATVTERIELMTSIAILPYRMNSAFVAKQAASVQVLSGGRLKLGLAAGGRDTDYKASKADFENRNARFTEMVEEIKDFWAGSKDSSGALGNLAVGPDVSANPPKLILGGYTDVTFRRVAKYADGWVAGGVAPDQFAQMREGVLKAWKDAGREGEPYVGALAYFALGETGPEDAQRYLADYYEWLGEETVGRIVNGAAKDAETVKSYIRAFTDAGCQELIFFPTNSDPQHVDRLAEAAL